MKSVLISIQPRYCENIASGKKTIEVRKTAPKLKTPFKCYIYETKKDDGKLFEFVHDGDELYGEKYHGKAFPVKGSPFGYFDKMQGKVIGEFVCDKVYEIFTYQESDNTIAAYSNGMDEDGLDFEKSTCLTEKQLIKYLNGTPKCAGYGWHISELKIYDKPKELSEFTTPFCQYEVAKCKVKVGARLCKHFTFKDALGGECDYGKHRKHITRPPQSWCYVEEVEK